jgi:hypothetical protein
VGGEVQAKGTGVGDNGARTLDPICLLLNWEGKHSNWWPRAISNHRTYFILSLKYLKNKNKNIKVSYQHLKV